MSSNVLPAGKFVDNMLVVAAGSSSVVNLPAFLRFFKHRVAENVRVLLTASAASFLPVTTVALFADGAQAGGDDGGSGWTHVQLAGWAEVVLVLPATANTLGNLALGLAPTQASATLLAFSGPTVVVPAMSPSMWRNGAVQRNVEQLRADGYHVVAPELGPTYAPAAGTDTEGLSLLSPSRLAQELYGAVRPGAELVSRSASSRAPGMTASQQDA